MMMTSKDVSAMAMRSFSTGLTARCCHCEERERRSNPLTLAMTTRMLSCSHHHHHRILDQLPERADQFGAERAIDGAVVAGQRHAHDPGDLDLAVAHDRPFLAGADREDGRMRRVDHGGEILDPV